MTHLDRAEPRDRWWLAPKARHNEVMTSSLVLRQTQQVTLDEVNGPWVWLIVSDYDVAGDPTDEELFAALIDHDSFVTDVHVADASHGPYLVSAVRPSDFKSADAEEVERQFGDWIVNEGPTVPLDPEAILAREIRPRLTGRQCYMFKGLGPGPDVSSENSETLGGWIEVIAVDRAAGRLRTIAGGSD